MFRRMIALLFALVLFSPALAEEISPYEVYTFAGSLPACLQEPLADIVPDEKHILSGAAIQHNGSHYNDAPEFLDVYSAMLLLDTADGPRLYAAALAEGLPWQVNDFTHFLRRRENVSISIYRPQRTQVPVFSLDYYAPEGLVSDLFCFWNNQLWCMEGHIDQANAVTITNDMGMVTVMDNAGREMFRCADPFFLDYMSNLSAFPTSRAEAQANSWLPLYEPFTAGMTLYCQGANLRREPTTKSESLGQYAHNVPMVFTGEQKQGTSYPWYQVRIGNTLGWMSGNYVADTPNLGYEPVPLGRTADGCPMYAQPGDAQPIQQLEPGPSFYILAEYQDMYHICVPSAYISWAVDVEGLYGYIPKEGVLTAASISALNALEAAK